MQPGAGRSGSDLVRRRDLDLLHAILANARARLLAAQMMGSDTPS
jgi:hypothetical protein